MTDEPTRDEQLDAILDQLEEDGYVETYTDAEGRRAVRLTASGVRVQQRLAMLGEDGQDELMARLLEARDEEA